MMLRFEKSQIADWWIPIVFQASSTLNKLTKKLGNLGTEGHSLVHNLKHTNLSILSSTAGNPLLMMLK